MSTQHLDYSQFHRNDWDTYDTREIELLCIGFAKIHYKQNQQNPVTIHLIRIIGAYFLASMTVMFEVPTIVGKLIKLAVSEFATEGDWYFGGYAWGARDRERERGIIM